MAQVERDVMRTHPDMHFFTGDSEESELHREVRALFSSPKLYLSYFITPSRTPSGVEAGIVYVRQAQPRAMLHPRHE